MQIVFHLGAHCTDEGLLIRSILQNRERLAREGIVVPGPLRYRELFGEISTRLRGATADPETEALIMAAICDDETAERVVLSNENFLCRSEKVLGHDGLYAKAEKSAWLAGCVPSHEAGFALAIRNPASFLPELARSTPAGTFRTDDLTIETLLWSDVVADIISANPGSEVCVWCHEDTPFIWLEIMRELTGHDPYSQLEGEFDVLETIMTEDGMDRLQEFLASRTVSDQFKRRRAVSAFLDAHAIDDAIEEEIDLPGWTESTVRALTELYEEDTARIAAMPGVTFISP